MPTAESMSESMSGSMSESMSGSMSGSMSESMSDYLVNSTFSPPALPSDTALRHCPPTLPQEADFNM
ncbi:MAG TPA: hypothetical protein VFZ97_01855 [Acidimicrobiales bacterium]